MPESTNTNLSESEMTSQLELSFHQQFAQNQNHHQNVLFKLLTLLAAVILGYGYILHGYNPSNTQFISTDATQYDLREVLFAFVVAQTLLIIGLAVASNMAYGFRRDQLVNSKIRRKHGLIAESEDQDNIFPYQYNPLHEFVVLRNAHARVENINVINWMPEFHKIMVLTFIFFQTMCVLAIVVKGYPLDIYQVCRWIAPLSIGALIGSLGILIFFQRKIIKYYEAEAKFLPPRP